MADYRFSAADEYPHSPSEHKNFNESVYVNGIDHGTGTGAWLRLGNRANEGYAEMQMCIYLPNGKFACQFQRPAIADNDAFEAGGLHYSVNTPSESVSMRYEGQVLLLDDLELLRDPKRLFVEAPSVDCSIAMDLAGISPIHGGEPVDEQQPTMYGRDFSLGHFFQHTRTQGSLKIDGDEFPIDGFGWRDHSWGPRYWTNINFYRLLLVNFDDGSGFTMLKITDPDGTTRRCGVMNIDGEFEEIIDVDLLTDWTARKDPRTVRLGIRTANRAEVMHGEVRVLAPLRNRRKVGGEMLESRIAEGFTEWMWGNKRGFGLSEYIERLDQGEPVGYPF